MNTTSSSLTKQLNYSKSSPANSSSNIHPSSTNSDLKETQPTTISTTSSFSSSEKNRKIKNSNSSLHCSASKRTYSSSSSASNSSNELLPSKIINSKGTKQLSVESLAGGSERSAKSKAIQAISKTLNKSFNSNNFTEISTKKSSAKEIDNQNIEALITDKSSFNKIIQENSQDSENLSYKKSGKRRKSSGSETKEIDKFNLTSYNTEISPSSKDSLNRFRRLKSTKSHNFSRISTDFNIPSKKAKVETNFLVDQPTTSKLSQKEDNNFNHKKEIVENRKLNILIVKILYY